MINNIDLIHTKEAIELSKKCPKSNIAYSVGAILVTGDGQVFSGYSRETDLKNHAEEEVFLKALKSGLGIKDATLYSSMEPCSKRKSKEKSCSELIIKYGIAKLVFAASEPNNFVVCEGEKILKEAGVEVIKHKEFEKQALEVNKHIFHSGSKNRC